MALSCYFSLRAPAAKTAAELEHYFKTLEKEARGIGFNPTLVVNAEFDTDERRKFARRLTTGLPLESDMLKGVVLLRADQVFSHDPVHGNCRVMPRQGVFLVVTDERRTETVFGLLRFPEHLLDVNGREVIATNAGKDWRFDDFIDTPDPRYRKLLQKLREAGYLARLKDEYDPTADFSRGNTR